MEAQTADRAAPFAWLDVVSGPAAGQRLPLEGDIRFGCEEPGVGALSGDRWLSREHAAVRRDTSGYFEVADLGSVEGTTVNGSSLRAPKQLQIGDVIELGSTRIVVRESDDPPAAAPADQAATARPVYAPPSDSRRVLAAIADAIIEIGIVYGALQMFLSMVPERGTNVILAAVGFLIAAQFTYRFLFESLTGQTLGKRLFGIRVVRVDGRPLDPNAALVRTVLLLVDGWMLIGLLTMVLTGRRRRRRIGDLAAGTIVVPASAPHPGFARRERDRLMLASPVLWLVTIAIALRILGPGLQTCHDAGVEPPTANEGACVEKIDGMLVELRVVNAGHRLSLPSYDVTLQRAAIRPESGFRSRVSFKITVTNKTTAPLPFELNPAATQLWVPRADGGSAPVPADGPARLVRTRQIGYGNLRESGWLDFTVPTAALGSITDPTSDLAFLAKDGGDVYLGEIRLWRASGPTGQAAVDGLSATR
jgi:uncharacterized RDD family membrane protein YckC